jgi:ribosomal protein S3AE
MAILKKKFFAIETPVLNTSFEIFTTSAEDAVGRRIKIDLTRQLKGKNLEAIFEIVKKADKIIAQPISAALVSSYMRRVMRKGVSYVEDSFLCNANDAVIRIKFFMLTRKKIHRSLRNALRVKAREIIIDFCKDKTTDEIFSAILESDLQKELSLKLRKIYPLSFCEIRAIKKEK